MASNLWIPYYLLIELNMDPVEVFFSYRENLDTDYIRQLEYTVAAIKNALYSADEVGYKLHEELIFNYY